MFQDDIRETNEPANTGGLGLAVASLVLGILAVFLSFLLFGGVLAVVGLILGIIHLSQEKHYRALAGWGLALSVCGGVLSVAFGVFYWVLYTEMMPAYDFDMMEGESLAKWEGVRAPDMTLPTLDGEEITLSDLKGKRVIVDLWATWCSPCVQEIPHFIQLAGEIPDDLVIIGVSDEDPETLNPFIKKKGINYPIVSQTGLPSPYDDANSIPTTFFIDRNGVIQKILSGYHDYETLLAAATAPDFEGTPLDAPPTPRDGLLEADTSLEATELWSVDVPDAAVVTTGDWNGDGEEDLLVTTWGEELTVLGPDGSTVTTVALPEDIQAVYLVAHTTGPRLLGVSFMDNTTMMGLDGEVLWTYKGGWFPTYMESVHWGDVDGDGNDEIALGMMNGLHLVSADGKRRWRNRTGGMGDVAVVRSASGDTKIATTDYFGVNVFDADGEKVTSFSADGDYCEGILAAPAGQGAVQWMLDGDEQILAVNEAGVIIWTAPMLSDDDLMAESFCAVGDVDGDGVPEFVFHEEDGGLAIASGGGERLGRIPDQQDIDHFAIAASRVGGGRLITLNGETVTAYTFALAAPQSTPLPDEPAPEPEEPTTITTAAESAPVAEEVAAP